MNAVKLQVEGFFDPATWTLSYLVLDAGSNRCALVDSVLDYDPKSGRTGTGSADRLIARVRELGATVDWLLETHVHADHLSAAPYLQEQLGGKLAIGEHITKMRGKPRNSSAGMDSVAGASLPLRLLKPVLT